MGFTTFTFTLSFSLLLTISTAATFTNLTQTQPLTHTDFLTSKTFTLGFFTPTNSASSYLAIWYSNIPTQTIVWVANRLLPIPINLLSTTSLHLLNNNSLTLSSQNGTVYWSSTPNDVVSRSSTTDAVLSDAGNLILTNTQSGRTLWQSFDHPTDTYLPGMEVLVNRRLGVNKELFSSWKSSSDPSPGRFTMGVDPKGSPQIVVWDEFQNRIWRSGHWNGLQFVGVPNMTANYLYGFKLSNDEGDGNMYFTYTISNSSTLFRFLISEDGVEELLVWDYGAEKWVIAQSQPETECDRYNKCGKFATCTNGADAKTFQCSCFKGFVPEDEGDWSKGCVRSTLLQCEGNGSKSDGFLEMRNVKLPDFADSVQGLRSANECKEMCLGNCSCKGYVMTSGLGCFIWYQDLVDIRQFNDASGKTLYVRLAASDLGTLFFQQSELTIRFMIFMSLSRSKENVKFISRV